MYHLSAYFMAKLLSELPLMLFSPSLFHIITYWIVGISGVDGFFGTWLVIIVTCLVGQVSPHTHRHTHTHTHAHTHRHVHTHTQSYGLLLGAVIMDFKKVIAYGSVSILGFMLIGGFYVQALPFWLQWAQYLSFITYGFDASLQFNYPAHVQYR